ncbi:hypothetical protein AB0M20_39425, partial [Actinoplanes sp. NPDC051633]|uniref:hypothetical protein n=1 Tax=Actinoplanes sp. NPDC051633 TaxID=3155670 RepID=UPI00341CCA5E
MAPARVPAEPPTVELATVAPATAPPAVAEPPTAEVIPVRHVPEVPVKQSAAITRRSTRMTSTRTGSRRRRFGGG